MFTGSLMLDRGGSGEEPETVMECEGTILMQYCSWDLVSLSWPGCTHLVLPSWTWVCADTLLDGLWRASITYFHVLLSSCLFFPPPPLEHAVHSLPAVMHTLDCWGVGLGCYSPPALRVMSHNKGKEQHLPLPSLFCPSQWNPSLLVLRDTCWVREAWSHRHRHIHSKILLWIWDKSFAL